jgi:molybdate transport system substrate-binding protein
MPIMKHVTIAGLVAIAITAAPTAKADELIILSAAAVRPALIEVPPLYAKASGHRMTVSFGNATAIQNKVTAGDPVDVVILPPAQLDPLVRQGLLSAGRSFGVVRLGVAAHAGATQPAVATPDEFKRALLAAPSFGMPDPTDGSTSSTYLVKLMNELGIADAMRSKISSFPMAPRRSRPWQRVRSHSRSRPLPRSMSWPECNLSAPCRRRSSSRPFTRPR